MPFGLSLWNWELYGFLSEDERLEAFSEPDSGRRRPPALRVTQLRKEHAVGRVAVTLLDGVDLSLAAGEIVTLAGPPGAGKTLLLQSLAQLDQGIDGTVEIEGQRPPRLSKGQRSVWRRKIALVTADEAVLPSRSVARNLALPLEIAHWPRHEIERKVAELVTLLNLEGLEERYPRDLSTVNRIGLAIGRALAQNAKVLLLDDALSDIEPGQRRRLSSLLRSLARDRGLAILLATRDPDLFDGLHDRVVRMEQGRVAASAVTATETTAVPGLSPWPLPCGHAVLRLAFDGPSAGQPVLSDWVRQQGVSVNLIQGNLGSIGGRPQGELIVSLPFTGEHSLQQAIEFLADRKVTVEFLGYGSLHGCSVELADDGESERRERRPSATPRRSSAWSTPGLAPLPTVMG